MFEIYSEVRAILSSHVVGAIEGCVMDAVRRCVPTAQVERVDETRYQLCGTLDGILVAKGRLEELLASLAARRKESSERDSTTLSDDGDTSYDREGTDKTSCLSDDRERETNASSNGYVSTNTEASVRTLRLRQPLSKKMRFIAKERPRAGQRARSARLALQLRTLKKKSRLPAANDPDRLSENLRHMKLATEDSDPDSGGTETGGKGPDGPPKDGVAYKHFCKLCSFKTKRSSHFSKHMAIHEKVSTLHKCGECSFTSVRLSHLRRHEMSHSATVHPCGQCHYKTDDLKFLLRHVKLKHRTDKGVASHVLSCPHCSYQTTKQHYYERHQRMHCSKRNFLHQCEQCCYKTHRKEHFVRHVNNVHGDKRPYLCHLCGKAFKRADALQQHHLTHEGARASDAPTHRCGACDKVFRSQSHLFEHRAVHSEVRSFLCEVCGASFKTRSVHRKHVLSIHRNPRAYSCDACPKKFNTLYALKRHRKVHSGKNPRPQNGGDVVPPAPPDTPMLPAMSSAVAGVDPVPVDPEPSEVHSATPLLRTPETTTLLFLTNNVPQFQ